MPSKFNDKELWCEIARQLIRNALKMNNMSQSELCFAIGYDNSTLSRFLNGSPYRRISFDVVMACFEVLQIDLNVVKAIKENAA